jgi:zinc transport system substrate-binding protein
MFDSPHNGVMSRSRPRSVVAVPLSVLLLAACGADDGRTGPADLSANDSTGADRTVVTELYPLQFVAERVAGDDLDVVNLAPPGVEPHDLELSPSQVGLIAEAQLVLYLADFAPAIDEAVEQNAADRGLDVATLVELVAGAEDAHDHAHEDAEPSAGSEHGSDGEHADEDHATEDAHAGDAHAGDERAEDEHAEDEHDHGALDPHFWLDPTVLGEVASAVAERMGEVDPENADAYTARADDLVAELDALDEEYEQGLAACDSDVIVTAHAAFGYLASHYGLEQYSVAGLEPDAEPSAARIAEVQHVIEEEGVTTVYFEPLAGTDVIDSIASDLGIETAELDPIESIAESGDEDYFSVMRDNLDALRSGLGCS